MNSVWQLAKNTPMPTPDADIKLSPKRERFAQLVAKYGNQSAAYREAYPTSVKWKDAAVHVAASQLMAEHKVRLRVEQLRAEVKDSTILDAQELRQFWASVVREGAEMKDRLKASELAGKADGLFVERRQVDGNMRTVIVTGVPE